MILQTLSVALDGLLELARRLPSVDALRPASCPGCGALAVAPGGRRLGIVGHGTYERQVLGVDTPGSVVVPVRRFLCCTCQATTSVLPDVLYPRRWYGAWVILEALVLACVVGKSIDEVRRAFGLESAPDQRGWRSLSRWRSALLAPLWGWLADGLGVRGSCDDRDEARRRLTRLLGQRGARPEPGEGARVAPLLLHGHVHGRESSWLAGHARPGADRRESPS